MDGLVRHAGSRKGLKCAKRLPTRRCFTLVELLIVVGIIAILAAMLLPVLSKGKAAAKRIRCASNLHQIGISLRLYVDEFRKYPVFGNPNLASPQGTRSVFWDSQVLPYASGNQAVFMCTVGTNSDVSTNWSLRDTRGYVWPNRSYGYNAHGVAVEGYNPVGYVSLGLDGLYSSPFPNGNVYLPEATVRCPADMIASADYDPFYDDDYDGDLHPNWLMVTLTGKRHNRGANVVFCDAHVEYAKTNRLSFTFPPNPPVFSRQRWNNDHGAH